METNKLREKSLKLTGKIHYYSVCLCLSFLIIFSNLTFGQESRIVNGTVKDQSGQSLPGVSVVVKGTTTGTISNAEGNYTLRIPAGAKTLTFSFVGMRSQEIAISGMTSVNVVLEEEAIGIEEVVAVGYSTQSRSRVISSISTVNKNELKEIPSVSPVQALQGKIAGVTIPVLTGQPGADANIVIRGGTTLRPFGTAAGGSDVTGRDSSDPLVIVDGVFRSLGNINSLDIESIQVMKDAASTAIYGARGANGVIVVKTKSGKVGKPTITFDYKHGIESQSRKYDYLSGRDYITMARKMTLRGIDNFNVNDFLYVGGPATAIYNYTKKGDYGNFKYTTAYKDNLVAVEGQAYVDNLLSQGWETMDDPVNPGKTIIFKDSHYQDVVWQTAHTNNYNISLDGGTEAARYNVSLGYVNQGGTFLGTGYKRLSALANSEFKVSKKFSISANLSFLWNDNKYVDNTVNILTRGVRVSNLGRLYLDDGTPCIGEGNNPRNRLHELYYQDYNRNTSQFIFRLAGDYEIIPNLHYKPSASLYTTNYQSRLFEKFYPQQPNPRRKDQQIDVNTQVMTDHILQYNHTFGKDHNVMALAGFNYTLNQLYSVYAFSQRSTNDYVSTISGDPATSIINGAVNANFNASSIFQQTKSASYFAQFNYDYQNKYLFGATIRRDGFSNFAAANQYATFPSLSLGWNISNEDFWKADFMNLCKLRTSWGSSGLSNLSINDTFGLYAANSYGQESGIYRANLSNPNLVWETTNALDIGFDMGFFKNRLNVTVDWYNKLTKNQLAQLPLQAETGFSSITYNVGSLKNRGIEFELQATVLKYNDFSWNSTFSFAYNRSTVMKLPANGKDKNRINGGLTYDPVSGTDVFVGGWAEGERPGGLWAWQSLGIFATDAEAQAPGVPVDKMVATAMLGKPKHGGDVNWNDVNKDGFIDAKDLVFMGYMAPDKIGGMQNTFKYKRLSMRFTLDYALGNVINDGALGRSMGIGRSYNEGVPYTALGNETWQNQGDVGKKYARVSWADYDIGYRNHLRFVSNITGYQMVGLGGYGVDNSIYYCKGDWIAIRELSFSYELPGQILKNLNVSGLALTAGVFNLGYITKYKGLNPEQYKGYDEGAYPRPLQFTFSVKATF